MRLRKTIVLAVLAALLGVLLGACGSEATTTPTATTAPANTTPTANQAAWEAEWEATLAAAREEGKVVVTSCGGEARRRAMTEGFEEKYGIQVEHSPVNSRDLWPKVVTEATLGQHNFDVRIGGADTTTFSAMYTNNTHMPIDFDEWLILPEVADESKWLGGFDYGWLDEGHKYAWSILLTTSAGEGFWVNRNLVSEEELNSVEQLADPKWKGKIISISSEGGSAQNTMMMQMIGYGEDWLEGLIANEPVVVRDHRQQIEALIHGQYAIATTLDTTVLQDFQSSGADISFIEPLDQEIPSLSNACESLQLHADMPHPNAAKVYVNWLLSKEQQQLWNDVIGTNSRRVDVTPGRPDLVVTEEDMQQYRLSQDEALDADRERFVELAEGTLIQ